jgi:hypothetical protein
MIPLPIEQVRKNLMYKNYVNLTPPSIDDFDIRGNYYVIKKLRSCQCIQKICSSLPNQSVKDT